MFALLYFGLALCSLYLLSFCFFLLAWRSLFYAIVYWKYVAQRNKGSWLPSFPTTVRHFTLFHVILEWSLSLWLQVTAHLKSLWHRVRCLVENSRNVTSPPIFSSNLFIFNMGVRDSRGKWCDPGVPYSMWELQKMAKCRFSGVSLVFLDSGWGPGSCLNECSCYLGAEEHGRHRETLSLSTDLRVYLEKLRLGVSEGHTSKRWQRWLRIQVFDA